MAGEAKGKRKVFYTIGGMGLKPDKGVMNVGSGPFTKKSRGLRARIIK